MKFIKVTALAAAMAASFGAQAELAALEDEALEAVTGQEGITIEQNLNGVDVWYVDSDSSQLNGTASATNSGAIAIENVSMVTAADTTAATGGMIMTIDVADVRPSGAGPAIRIAQTMTGILKVEGIKVGTAAQAAANANQAAILTAASGGDSIGALYVDMGTGMNMYVYGH